MRGIPLLILRDIALDERDAHRPALIDEHVVLETVIAPDGDAHQHRRDDGQWR